MTKDKKPLTQVWGDVSLSVNPTIPNMGLQAVLYNSSGIMIGVAAASFGPESISKEFLTQLKTTKRTYVAIIDSEGLMLATTHPVPYLSEKDIPKGYNGTIPKGCLVSDNKNDAQRSIMLCRSPIANHAWSELREFNEKHPIRNILSYTGRVELSTGYSFVSVMKIEPGIFAENMEWRFILITPEDDILGEVYDGRNYALLSTAGVFILSVAIATVITKVLFQPLNRITTKMHKMASLEDDDNDDMEPFGTRSVVYEVSKLQASFESMRTSLDAFSKYVPRDVVQILNKAGTLAALGLLATTCTISFTDVAKFTTMCQYLDPITLAKMITPFFEVMTNIVMCHGGVVDKYIGDCLMVIWGAIKELDFPNLRASCASLVMDGATRSKSMQRAFEPAKVGLLVRTGIHSGECLAGNMGTPKRLNYTVLGDAVNLAARLEPLNKDHGTRIAVSGDVADCGELGMEHLVFRLLGAVQVVGRNLPTKVYELVGLKPAGGRPSPRATPPVDKDALLEEFSKVESMQGVDSLIKSCARMCGTVTEATERRCARYSHAVKKYIDREFDEAIPLLRMLQTEEGSLLTEEDKTQVDAMLHDCLTTKSGFAQATHK